MVADLSLFRSVDKRVGGRPPFAQQLPCRNRSLFYQRQCGELSPFYSIDMFNHFIVHMALVWANFTFLGGCSFIEPRNIHGKSLFYVMSFEKCQSVSFFSLPYLV